MIQDWLSKMEAGKLLAKTGGIGEGAVGANKGEKFTINILSP